MILVDTSVWISVLKDKKGHIVATFQGRTSGEVCGLTRFTQLELLQGARDEKEWKLLEDYLASQYYLEAADSTWPHAARIYYDLRRRGVTVCSPIDCCIAQIAIDYGALLLHQDRDFIAIAKHTSLDEEYLR